MWKMCGNNRPEGRESKGGAIRFMKCGQLAMQQLVMMVETTTTTTNNDENDKSKCRGKFRHAVGLHFTPISSLHHQNISISINAAMSNGTERAEQLNLCVIY